MSKGKFVFTSVVRCLVFLGLGLWMTLSAPVPARSADAPPTLTSADCVKCHQKETAAIAANGKAHKTELTCQSCHESHRPMSANNIPACSNCHSGEAHFEVKGCTKCHNPHSPLDITLQGELKDICLTCHGAEGKELKENPSKHTEFACNFCHADKHGVIPACTDCHESHSDQITQSDCKSCHQAHKPLALTYGDNVPSNQCAACHDRAFAQLTASKSKHHDKACVFCHAGKHKVVPQCSDCHGMPHAPGMHQRFPKCGQCHNTAHDLNNWPAKQETPKAPAAAPVSQQGAKKKQ
jgi:predicted CXXCH cytochrome family protein